MLFFNTSNIVIKVYWRGLRNKVETLWYGMKNSNKVEALWYSMKNSNKVEALWYGIPRVSPIALRLEEKL